MTYIKNTEPVSIILPTYNRAHRVGKAIESVLKQTYTDFELLVIDDGSTDETEQVVTRYMDKRVHYYRMAENGGQSKARNCGMQMAQYDYLAFEDSDDLWRPEKLKVQMETMQGAEQDVGMVYHKFRYDLGEGRGMVLPDEKIPLERKSGNIYEQLLWDNMVGMPTMLLKKECVNVVGGLDESLKCLEDYDFALRIAQKYKAIFINEIYLDATYSVSGVSGGDTGQYLIASCLLLAKYKADYLATDTFNHRVEIILRDAEKLGVTEMVVGLLEKVLQQ
ncbi:MAG: glycosyltransferase family 2 protein [Thermoflexaceae bacterium]|nr:glycosyltransferase family 2 protein [Thermoflexaceae bacterium]